MTPVLTKADMYRRIVAGEFGNTPPRFFDMSRWLNQPGGYRAHELWGVQHTSVPGFPGTRLDVPRDQVGALVFTAFGGRDYCVSPMVHQVAPVVWEGDVTALYACGNVRPAPGSWRTHMKKPTEWRTTAARAFFRHHMTPDSYDDLQILLDKYPDHVVELSILESCFGTVPGRNAVIWEVRRY